jgi:hypothetical protein
MRRRSGVRSKVLHTFDAKYPDKITGGFLAKKGKPLHPSKHGTISLKMKF